jgi:ABC-type multidrug transport system fused ATPase/permease subunit
MVLEYIENKKSILGYANINSYETEIDTLFTDRDKYFKVAFFAQSISKSLTDSIKNISIIVFFILSISEILKGSMEISSFIAMLTYFSRIYAPMTSIQEWSASLSKFKMVHQKIKGSLDIPLNLGINEDDELIFEECSFSYENEKEILNKFTLNVDAKIGIVGLSGEGKSTILKLMMGDVKPTKGKCTYGKKSTFDISKLIINSNLRIYSQEPEIFNDTLKFNITLGKIGVSHQEFDIETIKFKEALKNLFDKINKSQSDIILYEDEKALLKDIYLLTNNQLKDKEVLNNIYNSLNNQKLSLEMLSSILCDRKYYIIERYDEIISELEIEYLDGRDLGQRGGSISGGEKNKICLARFLLPNHKGYFILDEPFTSLDILSEKKCMKVLKKYILDSTGIIISHKLDIIEELCDKIIVLNDGITIENGTHKELIKLNGLYKELFINSSRKDKNFIY